MYSFKMTNKQSKLNHKNNERWFIEFVILFDDKIIATYNYRAKVESHIEKVEELASLLFPEICNLLNLVSNYTTDQSIIRNIIGFVPDYADMYFYSSHNNIRGLVKNLKELCNILGNSNRNNIDQAMLINSGTIYHKRFNKLIFTTNLLTPFEQQEIFATKITSKDFVNIYPYEFNKECFKYDLSSIHRKELFINYCMFWLANDGFDELELGYVNKGLARDLITRIFNVAKNLRMTENKASVEIVKQALTFDSLKMRETKIYRMLSQLMMHLDQAFIDGLKATKQRYCIDFQGDLLLMLLQDIVNDRDTHLPLEILALDPKENLYRELREFPEIDADVKIKRILTVIKQFHEIQISRESIKNFKMCELDMQSVIQFYEKFFKNKDELNIIKLRFFAEMSLVMQELTNKEEK